jgi:hypothetical protein
VADTGGGRIVVISPNGDEAVLGGYNQPTDAAFLAPGRLLVAEPGFQRAIEIDQSGRMLAEWGLVESGTVLGPHLAVSSRGEWAVTDPAARNVFVLQPGRPARRVPPDPSVQLPVGVAWWGDSLFVADTAGAAIRAVTP